MHCQCYGSENFSQHSSAILKVDHFKGFLNWSNVDKLVINSMSGCNYKNYKLNITNLKIAVRCLQSRLSLFVYIRNNVCIIYVHRNRIRNYSEL